MIINARDLRSLINSHLAILTDPRFERASGHHDERVMQMMAELHKEKRAFFNKYNYDWAIDRDAYNSEF